MAKPFLPPRKSCWSIDDTICLLLVTFEEAAIDHSQQTTNHVLLIDIAYLALMLLAVVRGYSKGFVVAVFSFLAVFIGLAAALKMSATVAGWLGRGAGEGERLLPVVAFVLILIAVSLVTRLMALAIEKALQIVMLGFINKLAGILLYLLLFTIIFSILLFFAEHIFLVNRDTIAGSYFYPFVQPLGPYTIRILGEAMPLFKNMFGELERFFGKVVEKAN